MTNILICYFSFFLSFLKKYIFSKKNEYSSVPVATHFEIIFEKKNLNAFNFKPSKRTVETSFKVHIGSTSTHLLEKRH